MPADYVPNEARVTVNGYVLLFSAAVSVLTGIAFGLAPALKSSRHDLVESLKDAGRSLSGQAGGRTRAALAVAEIALSVVLLMGASLTVRGFVQLQRLDLGFQPDRVLMVDLPLPPTRYSTYTQRIGFAERVLDAVKSLPGVESAAIGNGGMPFGGPRSAYSIEGQPKTDSRPILMQFISASYPRTMGIRKSHSPTRWRSSMRPPRNCGPPEPVQSAGRCASTCSANRALPYSFPRIAPMRSRLLA
jgi:hypothetical protein